MVVSHQPVQPGQSHQQEPEAELFHGLPPVYYNPIRDRLPLRPYRVDDLDRALAVPDGVVRRQALAEERLLLSRGREAAGDAEREDERLVHVRAGELLHRGHDIVNGSGDCGGARFALRYHTGEVEVGACAENTAGARLYLEVVEAFWAEG